MLLSEAIELFDLSMAGVRAEGTRRCYRESFQKLLGFLGSDMLLEQGSSVLRQLVK